jgi:DNA-binding MarR family transcriptional regulator
VGRLVEEGLVERQPAADDLRRRQLRLTRRGQRLVDRAPVPAQIRLIEGLRSLSPAELETLSALLNQVVRGMGATDEPPALLFSESPTLRRRKKH